MEASDAKTSIAQEGNRATWTNKLDFLLACIGFSVGLGNVWRFPYLCYNNGGGAFLIPYFLCVIIGGVPMFFLEVALGQFMSKGGIEAWQICPLFKGIGYASAVIVFFLNCYYNIILAWAFYYLFASFTLRLPWTHCDNSWNSDYCSLKNVTANSSALVVDPVTEFWEYKVLDISDGVGEMGSINRDLALCLLLAWIVVFLCICKGIKSSGKVMYITATSPYIFMSILFIRAATLPGAIDGVKAYLIPEWSKLGGLKVWVDAGTQIFFSYSISLGTLTGLGSYNKFHHNSFKDCVIFAGVNSGTSFFAGFVIFMTLGFMSNQTGLPVSEVAETGPGLAFIAYPKAVSQMPASPVWSVLFFFMIILLGLDSQFVGVEGFITAVSDVFPKFMARERNKVLFVAATCFVKFLIGLSMVCQGGMYVFQIFDYYSGSRIILIIALMECLVISYVYGGRRFYKNLSHMYQFEIPKYFMWMWYIGSPIFCFVIFVASTVTYSNLTYKRGTSTDIYTYPNWAVSIGWMLACSGLLLVPGVMITKLMQSKGTLTKRVRKLVKPRLKPHQLQEPQHNDALLKNVNTTHHTPEL